MASEGPQDRPDNQLQVGQSAPKRKSKVFPQETLIEEYIEYMEMFSEELEEREFLLGRYPEGEKEFGSRFLYRRKIKDAVFLSKTPEEKKKFINALEDFYTHCDERERKTKKGGRRKIITVVRVRPDVEHFRKLYKYHKQPEPIRVHRKQEQRPESPETPEPDVPEIPAVEEGRRSPVEAEIPHLEEGQGPRPVQVQIPLREEDPGPPNQVQIPLREEDQDPPVQVQIPLREEDPYPPNHVQIPLQEEYHGPPNQVQIPLREEDQGPPVQVQIPHLEEDQGPRPVQVQILLRGEDQGPPVQVQIPIREEDRVQSPYNDIDDPRSPAAIYERLERRISTPVLCALKEVWLLTEPFLSDAIKKLRSPVREHFSNDRIADVMLRFMYSEQFRVLAVEMEEERNDWLSRDQVLSEKPCCKIRHYRKFVGRYLRNRGFITGDNADNHMVDARDKEEAPERLRDQLSRASNISSRSNSPREGDNSFRELSNENAQPSSSSSGVDYQPREINSPSDVDKLVELPSKYEESYDQPSRNNVIINNSRDVGKLIGLKEILEGKNKGLLQKVMTKLPFFSEKKPPQHDKDKGLKKTVVEEKQKFLQKIINKLPLPSFFGKKKPPAESGGAFCDKDSAVPGPSKQEQHSSTFTACCGYFDVPGTSKQKYDTTQNDYSDDLPGPSTRDVVSNSDGNIRQYLTPEIPHFSVKERMGYAKVLQKMQRFEVDKAPKLPINIDHRNTIKGYYTHVTMNDAHDYGIPPKTFPYPRVRRTRMEGSYPNWTVDEERLPSAVLRYTWKGKLFKLKKFLRKEKNQSKINTVDKRNRSALHYASSWGCAPTTKLLLNVPGVLLNQQDENGKTPLYKAVETGSLEVVKLLIKAGADSRIPACDSRDPLAYLLSFHGDERYDLFRYLWNVSPRVNKDTKPGEMTFLHLAMMADPSVVVLQCTDFMIRAGLYVDARQGEGRTPAHLATILNRDDLLRLLMVYEANPYYGDNVGYTPIDYAEPRSRAAICFEEYEHYGPDDLHSALLLRDGNAKENREESEAYRNKAFGYQFQYGL